MATLAGYLATAIDGRGLSFLSAIKEHTRDSTNATLGSSRDLTAPFIDPADYDPPPPGPLGPTDGIVFVVQENKSSFRKIVVSVTYANGSTDLIAIDNVFQGGFNSFSSRNDNLTPPSAGNVQYSIVPNFGWPSTSITINIWAIDTDANETDVSITYNVSPAAVPQVANIAPSPGSNITTTTAIELEITDYFPFREVILIARYANTDTVEVIHDGTSFSPHFAQLSTRTAITNGYHYKVANVNGWPGAVTFEVFPIDVLGDEAS